jgi:hypothetical protein
MKIVAAIQPALPPPTIKMFFGGAGFAAINVLLVASILGMVLTRRIAAPPVAIRHGILTHSIRLGCNDEACRQRN